MSTDTGTLSGLTSEQLASLRSLIASSPSEQTLTELEGLLGIESPGQASITSQDETEVTATLPAPTSPAECLAAYYPFTPSRRQQVFLDLREHLEAFYGGAAGGGKSDALLMAALEYVHVPSYRAIIFRRTFPNLEDLIERSKEWLAGLATWNQTKARWRFPSGATLHFGHMQHESDKFNYKGPAFQFIGWDELTEFLETQYTYLFSRLRRPQCQLHKATGFDDRCPSCLRSQALGQVPLRVRGASNPDGDGIAWVKRRFISDEASDAIASGEYGDLYSKEVDGKSIPFVPSRVEDNPGLDQESYVNESLAKLDPVTRARLRSGNWKISAEGRIKHEWFRKWTMQGDYYHLWRQDGSRLRMLHQNQAQRVLIVDCAGSSDDVKRERQGKPGSRSVISVFDYFAAEGWLIWRHAWAARPEAPELRKQIEAMWDQWHPAWVGIEDEKTGRAIGQLLRNLSVKMLSHEGKDKLTRAARWLNDLEQGKFFVPEDAPWLTAAMAELLVWDGHPDTPFDHGDTAAYASNNLGHAGPLVMKGGFCIGKAV